MSYRLKLERSALKLRVSPRIPASLLVEEFLTVLRTNSSYTFGVDYELLDAAPIVDAATSIIAVYDQQSLSFKSNTVAQLLQQAPVIEQNITGAGPVTVNNNTGIVRVNQTVGAAITLNMGLASAKTCPVLISDWKGDAGTNNITINLTGADKFPGNLTSWTIGSDTGSVFLRPLAGVGYLL